MATLQDKAIADAQSLKQFMARAKALYREALDFQSRANELDYVAVWQAQPTAGYNADGTQAATDGSPNAANPIITGGLGIKANDLIGGAYFVNDFILFITGQALGTPLAVQNDRINNLVNL